MTPKLRTEHFFLYLPSKEFGRLNSNFISYTYNSGTPASFYLGKLATSADPNLVSIFLP